MAEITAALVKELREMTGAGMMECKKALVEAEGDIDKAVDVLRTRGLAAVAKRLVVPPMKARLWLWFPRMRALVSLLN